MPDRPNRPSPVRVIAALLFVASLALPALAKQVLWELDDPRGDDNGDGTLLYPKSSEMTKGDLDLIKLRALREKDGTSFEATFARPIRQPGRGAADELGTPMDRIFRFGFYTFNIDIYVDKDRTEGSGGVALLPGRKAEVDPAFAWDRAICLTPRPNEARQQLSKIVLDALRESQAEQAEALAGDDLKALKKSVPADLESRVWFPNRVRVRGQTVTFFVPDSFFGSPPQADWAYLVVVSGADSVQSLGLGARYGLSDDNADSLMILPIQVGNWTDRFGGGKEGDDLQPPLVDIIVPAGADQGKLLRDRDPKGGRPAVLPAVVPGAKP